MVKSVWATAIAALVAAAVLLTPATSEAQRRGDRGWRGDNYSRRGYDRDWNGGWGGYGYGLGYGLGSGYYGGGWYNPGYSSYSYPSYYTYDYGTPTYHGDTQYSSVPQYGTYSDSQSGYGGQTVMSNPNDATFTVRIADPNAQIWFQDYHTQQRGTVRQYESGALDPNSAYTFTVRAKWMQHGKQMDQTRHVTARAGQHQTVTFGSMGREQIPTNPQRQPVSNDQNNINQTTPNANSTRTRLPNSPLANQNTNFDRDQQGSAVNPNER